MPAMDVHRLNERLRHAAENATALATAPGAELACGEADTATGAAPAPPSGRGRLARRSGAASAPVDRQPGRAGGSPCQGRPGPDAGVRAAGPSGWRVQRELTGTRPAA